MHVAVFATKTGVKAITSSKNGVPLDCEYNFSSYLTENITSFKYKNQLINFFRGTCEVGCVNRIEHVNTLCGKLQSYLTCHEYIQRHYYWA